LYSWFEDKEEYKIRKRSVDCDWITVEARPRRFKNLRGLFEMCASIEQNWCSIRVRWRHTPQAATKVLIAALLPDQTKTFYPEFFYVTFAARIGWSTSGGPLKGNPVQFRSYPRSCKVHE